MFPSSTKGLSFLKIINGISKSLSVAEQIIPIYEQTKPMIKTARNLLTSFKEVNKPKVKKQEQKKITKKTTTASYSSSNNPTFFI